jgi:hypothetical protein
MSTILIGETETRNYFSNNNNNSNIAEDEDIYDCDYEGEDKYYVDVKDLSIVWHYITEHKYPYQQN